MSGNRRHAGGMKSAMDNLKKIDEKIAAEHRSSNQGIVAALRAWHEMGAPLAGKAADEIERLRARVDALMLEHCPKEMSDDQLKEWADRQQPADEPDTGLEVQRIMGYLRTIELACDARDDRQSVTYLGQVRAMLYRLSRASEPPSGSPVPKVDLEIAVAALVQIATAGDANGSTILKLAAQQALDVIAANERRRAPSTKSAARVTEPAMAMLPNDSHPGRGCSCRECLRKYPDETSAVCDHDMVWNAKRDCYVCDLCGETQ